MKAKIQTEKKTLKRAVSDRGIINLQLFSSHFSTGLEIRVRRILVCVVSTVDFFKQKKMKAVLCYQSYFPQHRVKKSIKVASKNVKKVTTILDD